MCDTQRLSQTTFGTSASKDLLASPNLSASPQTPGLDPPLMSSDPVTPRVHNSNVASVMVLFLMCSSVSFSIINAKRLQDFQPVCFYARNS